MARLTGLVTASTLGSLICVLVYLNLYCQERRAYLVLWAIGWSAYLFRGIVESGYVALQGPLSAIVGPLSTLFGAAMLVWATARWQEQSVPPWITAVTGFLILSMFGSYWIQNLSPYLLFLVSIWVAILRLGLIHLTYRTNAPRPLRIGVIAILALWTLGSPLGNLLINQTLIPAAPYRAAMDAIMVLVGCGMISLYLCEISHSLRSSHMRSLVLFEWAVDIMIICRPDGTLIDANAAARSELGYGRDTLLHMHVADLDGSSPPALASHVAAVVARGESRAEIDLRHGNGSALPCELVSRRLDLARGPAILIAARDIRERLAAEQSVRQEQVSAQRYLDLSGTLFVVLNPAGEILLANRSACATLGYSEAEVLGRDWINAFVHPDQQAQARMRLQRVAGRDEDSPPETAEGQILAANGQTRLINWHLVPIHDDDGQTVAVLYSGEDVTTRRQAEAALRDSEQRFRDLVASLYDIVFTCDNTGRITNLYGNLPEHETDFSLYIGRTASEILEDTITREHERAGRRALAGEHVAFEWSRHADGALHHYQTSMAPLRNHLGEHVGAVGVIHDITDLYQTRQALQESERYLSTLLSNLPGMAYRRRQDAQWTMQFVSEGCLPLTGYAPGALVGNHDLAFTDLIHSADRARVTEVIDRAVAEQHSFELEYRLFTAAGQEKWVWEQGRPVFTDPQDPSAPVIEGFITDVSPIHRTQEALRTSEARYRTIFDAVPSLVISLDTDWRIRDCNGRAQEMLGQSPAELRGRALEQWIDPADQGPLRSAFEQVLRGNGSHHHEYRLRHGGGKTIDVDFRCSLLQGHGPEAQVVCLIEDISERKMLHAQLRQMQKMEALGRLAGAVAHDFNNLLTVIGGYGHMALESLPTNHAVRSDLEQILAAGERAGSLTRQLLLFSRRHEVDMAVLDLNEVLREVESMLERLIGEDVQLELRLEPQLYNIKADARLIEQVLINLAVNARDAMPSGGELRIETTNVTLSPEGASPYPRMKPGDYAMLAVSDTGTGMTPDVVEHLFEPFFTTKEPGKGTGLGLSSVYAIVEQMQGDIQVYTALGQGSRFMVYLPATTDTQSAPKHAKTPPTPRGSETVLLIEDQREVRELVSRILTRLGYSVLPAGNGAEAVATARECAGQIDLVLSDVIMPDQMGPEIVTDLHKEYPDLRVLFMSGYTDQALAGYGVSSDDLALIQKPFTIQQLASRLRELLDG